jgi:hypothetical protein
MTLGLSPLRLSLQPNLHYRIHTCGGSNIEYRTQFWGDIARQRIRVEQKCFPILHCEELTCIEILALIGDM